MTAIPKGMQGALRLPLLLILPVAILMAAIVPLPLLLILQAVVLAVAVLLPLRLVLILTGTIVRAKLLSIRISGVITGPLQLVSMVAVVAIVIFHLRRLLTLVLILPGDIVMAVPLGIGKVIVTRCA